MRTSKRGVRAGRVVCAAVVAAVFLSAAVFPAVIPTVCALFVSAAYPAQTGVAAEAYTSQLSAEPVFGQETSQQPLFSLWATQQSGTALSYAVATDNNGAENIPLERRGEIYRRTYTNGTSSAYFYYNDGCFLNRTSLSAAEAAEIAARTLELNVQLDSDQPLVLIYHTHTTESYDRYAAGYYDSAYPSRSTDAAVNMVSVGAVLAQTLRENGIACIQSETLHDYPSYSGAYSRSKATILDYLEQYPGIVLVIDIHRDAISADGIRYKPVADINGFDAAQIMIITGADDGTLNMPNWQSNLQLAARIQNNAEQLYPGLMRPAKLAYCCYNQSVPVNALLFEVGAYANSQTEALYSAQLMGLVLAQTLKELA